MRLAKIIYWTGYWIDRGFSKVASFVSLDGALDAAEAVSARSRRLADEADAEYEALRARTP